MKSELVIVKGQEFKISVQDRIKKDDIFIEQYEQAADMLRQFFQKLKILMYIKTIRYIHGSKQNMKIILLLLWRSWRWKKQCNVNIYKCVMG